MIVTEEPKKTTIDRQVSEAAAAEALIKETGEFGVFATGDGTTPQEPVERWGRAA
jgi:hypothetical protein